MPGSPKPAREAQDTAWNHIDEASLATARATVLWIRTARAAGYGGEGWLPTEADFHKSALFERLRAGRQPLAEPPPLGLSCPWYGLVEDPVAQYVGPPDAIPPSAIASGRVTVLQNPYLVVGSDGPSELLVRDGYHATSYRFRLWFDPAYAHPRSDRAEGGWFIRNAALPDHIP